MSLISIKNLITLFATALALVCIVFSYIFPQHAVLILSIEILLLPSIYIIGNTYTEEEIKKNYESTISEIENDMERLEREHYILLNRRKNR